MALGHGWDHPDPDLVALIEHDRASRLEGYRLNPRDIEEHTNIETRLRVGGYRDRQVVEVVQNGVDAVNSGAVEGRVEVTLTRNALYVANNGSPLTKSGVESLLHSHLSDKRDESIGRFGLGFKSLLGVSRHITVLSRSISLEFEEARSREAIRFVVDGPKGVPVTRIAWLVDAPRTFAEDPIAATFAPWAVTIVRAKLVGSVAHQRLAAAIDQFPPEFALFAGESLQLTFSRDGAQPRTFAVSRQGPHRVDLISGDSTTAWRVLTRRACLTDEAALEDAGDLHRRDHYDITWAVPEGGLDLGWFCAWSRMKQERAPMPGALNAPWKTNDRSNVLGGPFNDALMSEMAQLIVEPPTFASPEDPTAPFDHLPCRDLQLTLGRRLTFDLNQKMGT